MSEIGQSEPIFYGTGKPEMRMPLLTDKQFRSLPPITLLGYLTYANNNEDSSTLFIPHAELLAERFAKLRNIIEENSAIVEDLASQTAEAFGHIVRSNNHYRLKPEILERLYTGILSADFMEWSPSGLLGVLEVFEDRNVQHGEKSAHIVDRYLKVIVQKLLHPKSDKDLEDGEWLAGRSWPFQTGYAETLIETLQKSPNDETLRRVYPIFANRIGLNEMRLFLQKYAEEHADFVPIWTHAEQALGFAQKPTLSYRQGYKEMQDEFVNYTPNKKLLKFETSLIQHILGKGKMILDMGFGPAARHMNALTKRGMRVTGIDVVPENAQRAKHDSPKLDVTIADWRHLPYPNNSFDSVYCLGRSAHSNRSVGYFLEILLEMHRLLGENGKNALIDLAVSGKGSLAEEQKKFAQAARNLGIYQFESGSIHDSPDQGKHTFDRLLLTDEQFVSMANACGFEAKVVAQKPYGENGNDGPNINTYWELTVSGKPMTLEQLSENLGTKFTTKPVRYATY